MINIFLADERGLDDDTIEEIERQHDHLDGVLTRPNDFVETPDRVPEYIREIEYLLQELWKFPVDERFHRYQYKVKWCTCPHMDNAELFGTDLVWHSVESEKCPYHGTNPATSWDDERFTKTDKDNDEEDD